MGVRREFRRVVSRKQDGTRLDVYLTKSGTGLTRSQVERIIKAGQVVVNGRVVKKPGYKVRDGDEIYAWYELPEPFRVAPEAAEDIPIVYEDTEILVINKPPGVVVHPAKGHITGTLVNKLLGYVGQLPTTSDKTRPGVVHRLDKDTSGLIVFAKTDRAVRSLAAQIASKTAKRFYLAVVWGRMPKAEGEIEAPIGRHPIDRKRMAVTPFRSKPALTRWKVMEEFGDVASLLEVELYTGRTHQIRVHLEYYGHPVVGDPVYSGREPRAIFKVVPPERREVVKEALEAIERQALHAYRLRVIHPAKGYPMEFEAPLPEDMERLLGVLRKAKAQSG